jgi:PKD repeat protein
MSLLLRHQLVAQWVQAYVTVENDKIIQNIPTALRPNYVNSRYLFGGDKSHHEFIKTYLYGNVTGPKLLETISNAFNAMSYPVDCDPPPDAQLTATPSRGNTPLNVRLDASASTDNLKIIRYTFDFGDGTTRTSTTPIVRHTYSEAGTYTATVTVMDEFEQTDTASATVEVTDVQEYIGTFEFVFSQRKVTTQQVENDLDCEGNIVSYTETLTETVDEVASATLTLSSQHANDGTITFTPISVQSARETEAQSAVGQGLLSSVVNVSGNYVSTGAGDVIGRMIVAPNGDSGGTITIGMQGVQSVEGSSATCDGSVPIGYSNELSFSREFLSSGDNPSTIDPNGIISGVSETRNESTDCSIPNVCVEFSQVVRYVWRLTPR